MTASSTGWKKGTSGNPKGRPRGSGEVALIRAEIQRHIPELINTLVARATAGDVGAARLLLERVVSPLKATETSVELTVNADTLSGQGREILAAIACGEIAPSQGGQILSALGTLAKVIETDEMERRIASLEARHES